VITHLVLFRPRADITADDRLALAGALSEALRAIPSIRGLRVGTRVMHGGQYEALMRSHYSHAALLDFDDVAGLREYLDHPAHELLARRFFEAFEDALMYDFDLAQGEAGIRGLVATS